MNVIKHTRNFQLLAASSCLLPIYHIGENALFVGFRAFRLRSGQLCQHRAGGGGGVFGLPDRAANDDVIRPIQDRLTRCCNAFLVAKGRPAWSHAGGDDQLAVGLG